MTKIIEYVQNFSISAVYHHIINGSYWPILLTYAIIAAIIFYEELTQ